MSSISKGDLRADRKGRPRECSEWGHTIRSGHMHQTGENPEKGALLLVRFFLSCVKCVSLSRISFSPSTKYLEAGFMFSKSLVRVSGIFFSARQKVWKRERTKSVHGVAIVLNLADLISVSFFLFPAVVH